MDEPRRITVSDPSRPAPPPQDELDGEEPRSRRGLYLLLVALAVLALLRGGDTVLDRRAAAAEERRLAAVVDLELTDRFSGGSESREQDRASVVRTIGLRNSGPRDVVLLSAAQGVLRTDGEQALGSGRDLPLQLTADVDCSTRPAAAAPDQDVVVVVRTESGRTEERRLPLPQDVVLTDDLFLQRACGYLEPFEAGSTFPVTFERRGDELVLDLEVANSGRTPLLLLAVGAGAGLAAEVEDGELPLELRPSDGSTGAVSVPVRVVLRVVDCARVRPVDPAGFADGAPDTYTTTFARPGGSDETTSITQVPDLSVLEDLLADVCP